MIACGMNGNKFSKAYNINSKLSNNDSKWEGSYNVA
jgi:hypothetical protein